MAELKNRAALALRILISILLLFILFKKIDMRSTLAIIRQLNISYFVIAFGIFLIIDILALLRWKMLLDAQGALIPLKRLITAFCAGLFLNLFLPSTIGGDVARTLNLGGHAKSRSLIAASVLLDRVSGFAALVLIALISLLAGSAFIKEAAVYWITASLSLLMAGFILVIFNNRLYHRLNKSLDRKNSLIDAIRKLHCELYFFRSKPKVLYFNLLYSFIIQIGSCLVSYFLLLALKANISLIYPLVLHPVITVVTTLPISIGGLGLRDISSVFFYARAGVPKDAAMALSILQFSFLVFLGFIAGIIYGLTLRYRRIQSHQVNPGA